MFVFKYMTMTPGDKTTLVHTTSSQSLSGGLLWLDLCIAARPLQEELVLFLCNVYATGNADLFE